MIFVFAICFCSPLPIPHFPIWSWPFTTPKMCALLWPVQKISPVRGTWSARENDCLHVYSGRGACWFCNESVSFGHWKEWRLPVFRRPGIRCLPRRYRIRYHRHVVYVGAGDPYCVCQITVFIHFGMDFVAEGHSPAADISPAQTASPAGLYEPAHCTNALVYRRPVPDCSISLRSILRIHGCRSLLPLLPCTADCTGFAPDWPAASVPIRKTYYRALLIGQSDEFNPLSLRDNAF